MLGKLQEKGKVARHMPIHPAETILGELILGFFLPLIAIAISFLGALGQTDT